MYHLVLAAPAAPSTASERGKAKRVDEPTIQAESGGPSSRRGSAPSDKHPLRKRRMKRVRPWSDATLTPIEQVVLRLIHVDPRLTVPAHATRLRDLVSVFLPTASRADTRTALKALRNLQAAAAIDTDAFLVGDEADPPELLRCQRMFTDLVRAAQAGRWPAGRAEREWPTVARLFDTATWGAP